MNKGLHNLYIIK